jgi:hypothetical protein
VVEAITMACVCAIEKVAAHASGTRAAARKVLNNFKDKAVDFMQVLL